MWPFPNPLDLFGDLLGGAVGWAWDKVIQGVYTWFADGLLLLMEWVWGVLDTATTPRLTEAWFQTGLVRPLAGISLGITIALMLGSAIQAGFGGRPELIADALKEGPKAIVASALTVTVMDVLIRGADVLSDVAWQAGRSDAQTVMDGLAGTMTSAGGLATTFLGPLALLFGMVGLLVTTVVLFMRSSLLYLVAAFAPIVWSSSVSPIMRGSGRRLVHVTVALVLAKPAISVTLVVGVKLLANAGTPGPNGTVDGAAALGTLISGFACFAIAGLSPWVVYRLLPSVEGAAVSSGIVGGWGRAGFTAVQAGLMAKSLGASAAASAATRALPQALSPATGSSGAAGGSASAAATRAIGGSSGSELGGAVPGPATRGVRPGGRPSVPPPGGIPSSSSTSDEGVRP
ncbi:MAG: hypothetical protein Q7V57_18425 [Actinomycetota bacterium]|nr:hypothetical protein [Actinomycetota bacterium]